MTHSSGILIMGCFKAFNYRMQTNAARRFFSAYFPSLETRIKMWNRPTRRLASANSKDNADQTAQMTKKNKDFFHKYTDANLKNEKNSFGFDAGQTLHANMTEPATIDLPRHCTAFTQWVSNDGYKIRF